jgi:aspartyl-tRNA synthetase
MNVVDLLKDTEQYIGKEITVTGIFDRPRKKHSNYLFFNIENGAGVGIQAVVKKDELGAERFKEIVYGLCHKDTVTVTGLFNLRSSGRTDFYNYEVEVTDIKRGA